MNLPRIDEGDLSGSGSDPEGSALTYAWDLDGDGAFETPGAMTTLSAVSLDGPASRSVTLRACDDQGSCATDTATVSIRNAAPAASLVAPGSVGEGTPIQLAFSGASDVPADQPTLQYAFDCGDGAGYGAVGASATRICPTEDNGVRSIGGRIRDRDGGERLYTATVVVANVKPSVTITTPHAEQTYAIDSPVDLAATFTDPGHADSHSCSIDWGDGTPAVAGALDSVAETCTNDHRRNAHLQLGC